MEEMKAAGEAGGNVGEAQNKPNYHDVGQLPCDWEIGRDCGWAPSDSDGTWICGCGKVKFHVRKFNQKYIACYCADCHNRTAIGLAKSGGKYNHFYDRNGGYMEANVTESNIRFVQGQDLARGFRCAVADNGTRFDSTRRTITVYASCCGTLMYSLLDKHPGVTDIANPDRVKGWRPNYNGTPFQPLGEETAVTGAVPPPKPGGWCEGEGNICCGGQCGWGTMWKTICLMCCTSLGTAMCGPNHCCYSLCCLRSTANALQHQPRTSSTFNGHAIEDITDPMYLWPPAQQTIPPAPSMAK